MSAVLVLQDCLILIFMKVSLTYDADEFCFIQFAIPPPPSLSLLLLSNHFQDVSSPALPTKAQCLIVLLILKSCHQIP